MAVALIWGAGFALLWLPGFVLGRLLGVRLLTVQLGLGLSFWPLLLLWISFAGLSLTDTAARVIFGMLVAGAASLMVAGHRRVLLRFIPLLVVGVVLVTAITRISHVRDLVLPAWVDSVHHTAIVQIIIQTGQVPRTYDPLIPQGVAFYHWGFHATTAALSWIVGANDAFELATVLLHFGQLLNVLTVVMMYGAGRLLFRSWRAGAIAAALAGTVSYFPAYFVSWGRYTHLGGLLVLLALAPQLYRVCLRRTVGEMLAAAMLAAGLLLIHARIAFFAFTFAMALGLLLAVRRQWRFLARWSAAAVIAALLASPWLIQLAGLEPASGIVAPDDTETEWRTPAEVRANHLWVPRNRELLALATGGMTGLLGWPSVSVTVRILSAIFWIVVIVCTERQARRKRRGRSPWPGLALLAVWVSITALLINLEQFGLPRLQLASNTAAVISLFIPLSLAGAGFIAWVSGCLFRGRMVRIATGVLVVLITIGGASGLMHVVNPATVLAGPADLEALRWIDENVPADARFAIRARPWIGGSFVGSDGGYWISVLTRRRSMLPPALYMWASPRPAAQRINSAVDRFSRAESLTDRQLASLFAEERVNYLYFGPRAAVPSPDRFKSAPFADLIYDRQGVKIFRVR